MSGDQESKPKQVHFTPITDTLFQALSEKGISCAGKDIVYYILRHTVGWQQRYTRLSVDEFLHGRRKKNGERYDHGTSIKSPHTVYAGIEEVGLAGFIFEIAMGDKLDTKAYALQPYWVESEVEKLDKQPPTSKYQGVIDEDGVPRFAAEQESPVYQGVTRGKPRKPRSAEHMQKLHRSKKIRP